MQIQNREFLDLFIKELMLNSVREEIEEAEEDYYEELKGAIDKERTFLEKIKSLERNIKVSQKTELPSEMFRSLSPIESLVKMPVPTRPSEIIEIEAPTKKEEVKSDIEKGIQKRFSISLEESKAQKPITISRPLLEFPKERAQEVNLGKLNLIISDPTVRAVECAGPDKPLFVRGIMGDKLTNLKLNKEEVDSVINAFSERTRIPVIGGIFRTVFGGLMISAVVSDLAGSRFIIKKIRRY